MPTTKLTIEYKGTRYQGWQEQAQGRTIQAELKAAAKDLFKEEVDLVGSGRTDAGVHALAQVAHMRTLRKRLPEQVSYGLNERLPPDIHVLKVEPTTERFHARHSAISRYYLYQVSTRRTAFAKDYVWWVKDPLDMEKMKICAGMFEGRHDFRSFAERPDELGSTIVVVDQVRCDRVDDLILIRFGASHFLWKMVRRLVGVMVKVGAGNLEIADAEDFIKKWSRDVGQHTAPASGLFLEKVVYPNDSPPSTLRPAMPVYAG
jgi:tRNA pseudouridine38-40 synthase